MQDTLKFATSVSDVISNSHSITNTIVGGTGTGKGFALCGTAVRFANRGEDVLYLASDMTQSEVEQRLSVMKHQIGENSGSGKIDVVEIPHRITLQAVAAFIEDAAAKQYTVVCIDVLNPTVHGILENPVGKQLDAVVDTLGTLAAKHGVRIVSTMQSVWNTHEAL